MTHIAVIGLGLMGSGIAHNLLNKGFSVAVHNRTAAKADALVASGARWAHTPREAATGAQAVLGVLGDDVASRASWLGADGAFAGMAPGALAVECSTLSVEWAREWIAAARRHGVRPIDATLAGSKDAARAASLRLFVGAEDQDLASAMPVLKAFSADQIHFGPPGSGVTYKLINNMWAAVQLVSLAEGLAIAERAGLNMDTVARAVPVGASASGIVKGKLAEILSGDYSDVFFALKWMAKDLTYAVRAADGVGAITPTAAAARELFKMAAQRGLGELDMPAVAEVIRGKT